MEDIILNVALTGWLIAFFCALHAVSKVIEYMPERLAIATGLMFWLSVSVGVFGTITFIWIR
ncbi:MAG: hypothetical protein GY941_17780 [Planctomycetes bacterium]|nr:hypothetical protein [Planctomycetota bacterium]